MYPGGITLRANPPNTYAPVLYTAQYHAFSGAR